MAGDDRVKRDSEWGKKLQDENQVKGRYGELLAAFTFPPHWIVRPIPDDYGLDLELEVFHEVAARADGTRRYQTRGEHLYLQVKTTDTLEVTVLPRTGANELPVAKFRMSTSDLKLVDLMGASVPVVLLLVDKGRNKIYYVCLTDYVSHYLDLEKTGWRDQTTVNILIPLRNELIASGEAEKLNEHWSYFSRLARRSKLYSAFNFIHYCMVELAHAFPEGRLEAPESIEAEFPAALAFVNRFSAYIDEIKRLDVWPRQGERDWVVLHEAFDHLCLLSQWCEDLRHKLTTLPQSSESSRASLAEPFLIGANQEIARFEIIDSIGRTYQELGRKERLPGVDPFDEQNFLGADPTSRKA